MSAQRGRQYPLLSLRVRDHRYAQIMPWIGRHILDVGCGNGHLADLIDSSARYIGIDLDAKMLAQARAKHLERRFYQVELGQPLPPELLAQRFDTLALIAVLEHLAQPQEVVDQLRPLLEPGGRLVATTPTPLGHKVHALGAQFGLFYREAAADHKSIFNRQTLTRLCQQAGLVVTAYHTFDGGCNQMIVATVPI